MSKADSGEIIVADRPASWVRDSAPDGRVVVILAHGAGAPYTSPFMVAVADGLVERGFCAVRFHFPYMELAQREEKRKPPNPQPMLLKTWERMIGVVRNWPGCGPIVLAGKSMGGRMASLLLADHRAAEARAAVYLGYPLHAPGRKDKLRDAHLPDVKVPQLFISGTRDNLCDLDLLRPVLERIGSGARLHVVEGGDHSLARSRKAPLEGLDTWLDAMGKFIEDVT